MPSHWAAWANKREGLWNELLQWRRQHDRSRDDKYSFTCSCLVVFKYQHVPFFFLQDPNISINNSFCEMRMWIVSVCPFLSTSIWYNYYGLQVASLSYKDFIDLNTCNKLHELAMSCHRRSHEKNITFMVIKTYVFVWLRDHKIHEFVMSVIDTHH